MSNNNEDNEDTLGSQVNDAIRPYVDEIEADLKIESSPESFKNSVQDLSDEFNTDIGKKRYYSLEEKLLVVEMIRRNGGVVDRAIVKQAQIMLKSSTVQDVVCRNWWRKYRDTPPAEVLKKAYGEWITPKELVAKGIDPKVAVMREEATVQLDRTFEEVAKAYLARALSPEAIAATKGRDAVWAAAVSVDKMRILRTVSSEIIDILPSIIDLMEKKGINPTNAFKDMYAALLRTPSK